MHGLYTCTCSRVPLSRQLFTNYYYFFIVYYAYKCTCTLDCVRVTATPTSSAPPTSQSLFSRLVSAITPAHLSRSRRLAKTKGSTPQLSTNNRYTPRQSSSSNDENTCTCVYMNGNSDSITSGSKFKTPSAHPRAKRHDGGKMSAVRVKLSDVPGSSDKDIEMKDFSSSLRKRNARLSTSFSTENHSERVRSRLGSDSRIPSFKLDSQSPVSNNYMLMETSSDGCGLHLYPPHVHTPGTVVTAVVQYIYMYVHVHVHVHAYMYTVHVPYSGYFRCKNIFVLWSSYTCVYEK